MSEWDGGAVTRLTQVIGDLEKIGFVRECKQIAQTVWKSNLERHEPDLGDTNTSLGLVASINLSELLYRRFSSTSVAGTGLPMASWHEGALVLKIGAFSMHVTKARPSTEPIPDWSKFSWSQSDSKARLNIAQNNSYAYQPTASDQDGRPQALIGEAGGTLWGAPADPASLNYGLVVWSGNPKTTLTAGWLTFPSLGEPSFFAVAPLWRDEGDRQRDHGLSNTPRVTDGETYADRQESKIELGWKKTPKQGEQ